MDKYRFGNYLTDLRTQRGLSQSELGAIVGVSNKAISKWENGEALPRLERLKKLADYFGVPVEELVAGGKGSEDASEAEPDLAPQFGRYDEENRAEKESLSDAYYRREIRRAVWGHRWTIIVLLLDYAILWLLLFPIFIFEFHEYRLSLPAEMAADIKPLGGAFAQCLLEMPLLLLKTVLIWRGYRWICWFRIIGDAVSIPYLVTGLAQPHIFATGVYLSNGLAVFCVITTVIVILYRLLSVYLFAFYRPVKDFLAEQREYYRA